jgi:hypothetical protein
MIVYWSVLFQAFYSEHGAAIWFILGSLVVHYAFLQLLYFDLMLSGVVEVVLWDMWVPYAIAG